MFPHLTALENVRVALQRQHGSSFDFWRSKSVLDRYNGRAHELLNDVGLSEFANIPAVEMPYGRKRALEIATTLALDPEMMLLDEPMAGMGHEDIDKVAALIKRISARTNRARSRWATRPTSTSCWPTSCRARWRDLPAR